MSTPWIIAFVVLCVVVVAIGLLTIGILRRISTVLEQAEAVLRLNPLSVGPGGLAAGSRVPDFTATDAESHVVTAQDLLREPCIVLFLSSGCEPCHRLVADLAGAENDDLDVPLVLVIAEGDAALDIRPSTRIAVAHQREREIADAFDTRATPHAFVVGRDRMVLETATPNSVEQLRTLALRLRKGGGANKAEDRRMLHA